MANFLTPAVAALVLALPLTANAATIENDNYDLTVSQSGDVVTSNQSAIFPVDIFDFSDPAVIRGTAASTEFEFAWVDGDTFFVSGSDRSAIVGLVFELAGLNFLQGGVPATIASVVFDPIATDLSGFAGFTSIVGPSIEFTKTSIKITLDFIPDAAPIEQEFIDQGIGEEGDLINVAADGVRFFFDVTARPIDQGPAAVPLPAGVWLLGGAVGLLAAASRRKAQ
jgi:hypothetical protein